MQKQYSLPQPQQLFNIVTSNLADVLIFKTNIETPLDKLRVKKSLDHHPLIWQWNIDLEDIDKVLRVEASHLKHTDIITLITRTGYYCEELLW